MAKGTKELRQRITGVTNIQKITRAMEMVATQKLKRLRGRAEAARPYAEKVQQMVARLAGSVSPELSPLLEVRKVRRVANLVLSSDKGLCGSYNTNVVRMALQTLREAGDTEQLLHVLGSKGARLLVAKGATVHRAYADAVERLDFLRVRVMARELVGAFLSGDVDELRLIYTAFLSAGRQRTVRVTILPIHPASLVSEAPDEAPTDFIIEPSGPELLKVLLPKFLEVKVYSAVLESLASEFTARRNAMKQATDSADEMIQALTREYNRARQEAITNELLEVVSGAEALK